MVKSACHSSRWPEFEFQYPPQSTISCNSNFKVSDAILAPLDNYTERERQRKRQGEMGKIK